MLLFSKPIIGQNHPMDGNVAPSISGNSVNGLTFDLYNDYINQDKPVILEISATWCGPCWSFHQTELLKDLYNSYGYNGSDEIGVVFVEGDGSTDTAALYGFGNNSLGNWVAGTPYPIFDDQSVANNYLLYYYPTLFAICPDSTVFEMDNWGNFSTANDMLNNVNSLCNTNVGGFAPQSWNCVNGSCVDPLDGSGAYLNLSDCQNNCSSAQIICQGTNSNFFWCDDFSNPSNWTLANNSLPPLDWSFNTDPNVIPYAPMAPFNSSSSYNGFLFIDSDATGGSDFDGTPVEVYATSPIINASAYSNVQLHFEHNYRWWNDTRAVRISNDGGVNWVNFDITDINGYPNNQDSGNPEITTIDISQIADFSDSLLIQFYYYDNDYWAWYWAVDDVKLSGIATIFQEDFSNGIPSDWQDHYFTSSGNIAPWEYRGLNTSPDLNIGSRGAYSDSLQTPIQSSTNSNGFIIFDSDYYDNSGVAGNFGNGPYPCDMNGHIGVLETPVIDCSNYSSLTLNVHSNFRYFAGESKIAFSSDGGLNYTDTVRVNQNVALNTPPSDELLSFVLPQSMWSSSQLKMQFIYDGTIDNGGGFGYYFWMIDDIQLIETPAYDADIIETLYAENTLEYPIKPLSQASYFNPYSFGSVLQNTGGQDLDSLILHVDVYTSSSNQIWTGTSSTYNLLVGETDTLMVSGQFNGDFVDNFEFQYYAKNDSLNSDTVTIIAQVSDTIYSRENGVRDNRWLIGGPNSEHNIGNLFEIFNTDSITSASAFIHSSTSAGAFVSFSLYEYDNATGDFYYYTETDFHQITTGDIDDWITLQFLDQYTHVDPGQVFLVTVNGYLHPSDSLAVGTSGVSPGGTSWISDFNGFFNAGIDWYWTNETPMVRLNMGYENTTTVYDIVSNSFDHTVLTTAIDQIPNLSGNLQNLNAGPFTLFAPTDAAFNNLPQGIIPALLADTAVLHEILKYHLHSGSNINSNDMTDGMLIQTQLSNNQYVTISIQGGNLFVDSAQIIVADIQAGNGVVHVIDQVLIPQPDIVSIYDTISALPDLGIFTNLINNAGYDMWLDDPSSMLTVFVPTDNAFSLLPQGSINSLLNSSFSTSTNFVSNYIFNNFYDAGALFNISSIFSTSGNEFNISFDSNTGSLFINDAQIVVLDILTDNGIIHIIDAVISPGSSICNPYYPILGTQDLLYPDTIQNLPHAEALTPYQEYITYSIPETIGDIYGSPYMIEIMPGFPVDVSSFAIDSVRFDSIVGLPSSMTVEFSDPDLTGIPGDLGCLSIYGTPDIMDIGHHDLIFYIDGWVNMPLIGAVSLSIGGFDYGSTGYDFIVNLSGCTDPLACNYNPLATLDDNSCLYATFPSIDITACDSYQWDGVIYNTTGSYTNLYIDVNGCDSVVTLNLTINSSSASITDVTTCNSYDWNGTTYTNSGIYTFSTTNAAGCDSTATLNLTINNATSSTTNVTTCDSYDWNGATYSTSGSYSFLTTNSAGCDSTAILYLTINNATSSTTDVTTCDSYNWNGTTYTTSGSYSFLTTNSDGCENTDILNLTIVTNTNTCNIIGQGQVNTLSTETYVVTQIPSSTFNWSFSNNSGNILSGQSTNVVDIIWGTNPGSEILYCVEIDSNGCVGDTCFFNVAINGVFGCTDVLACNYNPTAINDDGSCAYDSPPTPSINITACDSYNWNGTTYTASGVYSFTTTNAAGCDSTATLNLTINNATSSTADVTACDSYEWNGNTYTTSGSYSLSTTNSVGCDSTAILNLTINNANSSNTDITTCDSYNWNGNTYSVSGAYTFSTTNSAGCDSTATLNLTITPNTNTCNIIGEGQVNTLSTETYVVTQILGSTFNWSLGNNSGNILSGQSTNVVDVIWGTSPVSDVLYCVEIDSNGCVGDTCMLNVVINNTTLLSEIHLDELSVYPNPSHGEFNIDINSISRQNIDIQIHNLLGEVIYSESLKDIIGSHKQIIDLSQYANAMYILQINTDKGKLKRKLIVEK